MEFRVTLMSLWGLLVVWASFMERRLCPRHPQRTLPLLPLPQRTGRRLLPFPTTLKRYCPITMDHWRVVGLPR
ncbi:hypothetical protein SRHO_G00306860 [Serrasalmus rhombeus]